MTSIVPLTPVFSHLIFYYSFYGLKYAIIDQLIPFTCKTTYNIFTNSSKYLYHQVTWMGRKRLTSDQLFNLKNEQIKEEWILLDDNKNEIKKNLST